jgi:hypothetical protein
MTFPVGLRTHPWNALIPHPVAIFDETNVSGLKTTTFDPTHEGAKTTLPFGASAAP